MAAAAYAALAGLQIVNGLHQAQMMREQSALQQRINEMNAKYAEIDAYNAEIMGETEIAAYQVQIDQTVGEQRAGYAAQDVDVNFGTAKEVQEETKLVGFLNQIQMRRDARAKAMGLRREAGNIRLGSAMQAGQSEMTGRSAMMSGVLQAGSTGLSYYSRK